MAAELIIVSNRLPVTVTKTNGVLQIVPSNGGLATAIASLPADTSRVWIGWPGIASDDLTPADKRMITRELSKIDCIPVYLTQEQISNYYDGYANATLWPLFHYLPGLTKHRDSYWEAYRAANQLFARTVNKYASETSTIWIHDYHLMLLPELLRESRPAASIGFFLHTPFPSYEMFRLLPQRGELLAGLLGADLVGFHTYDYAVHFAHSVHRLLGYESSLSRINVQDRLVSFDAFPIGINYELFADAKHQPGVITEMSRLRKHFKQSKIILSMDRLDYSKGILNRLEAYSTFLERNPELHGKVSLAMVAIPSRTDITAYQQLRDQVDQAVSRINGRFGTVEWAPISYQYKNLPFEQIAALYAESSIALITPLRDGMNLVAKEFVATKQDSGGVLILSEMAGAADELPEAMRINPNDEKAMVRALERAISVPLVQQRKALTIMQSRISGYDVHRWASDFLTELANAHAHRSLAAVPLMGNGARGQLLKDFRAAKSRLILLDYDGVLTELVSSPAPEASNPTPERRRLLTKLAAKPGTTTAIISGRTRSALDGWFGDTNLELSAEHGAWYRLNGNWQSNPAINGGWKDSLLPLLLSITERTPGSGVEIKDFALVWHYRNVTPDLAYIRREQLKHELNQVIDQTGLKYYEGNKIIEVKPEQANKGAAAKRMLSRHDYDFILAIGDDYTDEHMFAALPETAYTIHVGRDGTAARHYLPNIESVINLLADLTKI